jgi:hypothetical protein
MTMATVESKEAAKYHEKGSPEEHCGNCEYFIHRATGTSGTCRIVSGSILFDAWCRHWTFVSEAAQ